MNSPKVKSPVFPHLSTFLTSRIGTFKSEEHLKGKTSPHLNVFKSDIFGVERGESELQPPDFFFFLFLTTLRT